MFEFHCPVCQLARPLPERAKGRTFRCPQCNSKIKSQESGPLEVVERCEPPPVVTQQPVAPAPPPPPPTVELPPVPSPAPPPSIPATSVSADALTGLIIGNYRVIGLLGSGAQSSVYLAEHQHLHRRNALKILPPDSSSTPEKTAKLLNEAFQLAKVDSPFVVRIYDCGVHERRAYLAMELVEGVTLDQRIKSEGPLRGAALSDMILQLLHGLKAVHAASLLHGDIKPTNILLTRDGQAKLADFGLAREVVKVDSVLPERIFAGTAEYAAPELALGRPAGPRTDLYALGATLYKAVTGRVPFPGDSTTEKLKKQLYEPLIPLRVYAPDLPALLETFISTLLDKDPEKRPISAVQALEFFDALKPPEPPPAAAPSPPTSRRPLLRSRPRRVLLLTRPGSGGPLLLLLLFAGLMGAGVHLYLKRPEPASAPLVQTTPPTTPTPLTPPPTSAPGETPLKASPWGRSSVLRLRTGVLISGLVNEKDEGYELREGDTLTRIPRSEVEIWYRSSGEMGGSALQELELAKDFMGRAKQETDPGNVRSLLMEARHRGTNAEQMLSLVRRYFAGKEDDWVDPKLRQARTLLKMIRDGLTSDQASAAPASPQKQPEARSTPPARTPPAVEAREIFRLTKPGDLLAREGSGLWEVTPEGLHVRGLEKQTSYFDLPGMTLPRRFALDTQVSLSKENPRLPTLFGIELDAGDDRPLWLVSIQNTSGTVMLYHLGVAATQWQTVVSTSPGFLTPETMALGVPLSLQCDGNRLDVHINHTKAFSTVLPRELTGGHVRVRCQGAQIQASQFRITNKD